MNKMLTTKEKVIKVATQLFYQKGFQGTSVRDIAQKAQINISQISYYFKHKQGLLEYIVTDYYEDYLEALEETLKNSEDMLDREVFEALIETIFTYRLKHFHLTSSIHRELSIDSTFVRE